MAKHKKTNAMRLLDKGKFKYEVIEYDSSDGNIDGVSVANKVNRSVDVVYKTLVLQGQSKNYYVCIVPVQNNLSLKAVSKLVGEKKIEMIHVKDILKITGYIRGGCSPLGMKKEFKKIVDESINDIDEIVFSAGKIGLQIEMKSEDFIKAINGEVANIIG